MAKLNNRPDHKKGHRMQFENNRKRIIASQDICAICGQPVDKTLKYPHPMSATVDHIIPVSKGGHPSDIDNLQLAHFRCNRLKGNKVEVIPDSVEQVIDNRNLPLSLNWSMYNGNNAEELRAEVEEIEKTGRYLYVNGIR